MQRLALYGIAAALIIVNCTNGLSADSQLSSAIARIEQHGGKILAVPIHSNPNPNDGRWDFLSFDSAVCVSLDGIHADEETVDDLCNIKNLYGLILYNTGITGRQLARLAGQANLRYLVISDPDANDGLIEQLSALPNLEVLWLPKLRVSDSALATIQKLGSLRDLKLEGADIGPISLEAICKLHSLKVLNLRNAALPTELSDLAKLNNLESLDLRHSDPFQCNLEFLEQLTQLRELNLSRPAVTDEDLSHVAHLTQLTQLRLDTATNITDEGVQQLTNLANLNELSLVSDCVTDVVVERLPDCEGLQQLYIVGVGLTNSGLSRICERYRRLETLVVVRANIDSAGLKCLWTLPSLRRLGLDDTAITDVDLMELRALDQLTELHLGGTNVSDDGIKQLALARLKRLYLNQTTISDEGAMELLLKLPALVQLDVTDTNVTENGIRQMKTNRQDLQIVH